MNDAYASYVSDGHHLHERSDEEVVKMMHRNEHDRIFETFSRLVQLLGGDELKAARALCEENLFVRTNAGLPFGKDFAEWTRKWLVINGREWNQDNLKEAAFHYQECR